jgi:hypothetical protein
VVTRDTFAIAARGNHVVIECWSATRNLVRRVRGILTARRGMLELEIERFGSRTGKVALIDLADPSNRDAGSRGARLKYRERFRRSLRRQFPDWRIAELSVEADLHHSLSPSYPRALLRKGTAGIAAIGADEDALSPEGALSFGLIWLDYLRRREAPKSGQTRSTSGLSPALSIAGLAIFVPVGAEATTCHRIRHLNPEAARYWTFVHGPGGDEDPIDPGDYTNFDTHLPPSRSPLAESRPELVAWVDRIAGIDGVQRRENMDGSVTLAVRGLEFARAVGDELRFGIDVQNSSRHVAGSEHHIAEIEQLAVGLAAMRHADAGDRMNSLYLRHPEAWLESQVRGSIEQLDATLFSTPLYGQVPHFAAGERSVIDILAVNRDGVLVVIELKASQDIHLPLRALDYWMRVKWHLDRGEFEGRGYFPGIGLRKDAPKLLLVAPALDFHPSNEAILRFFAKEVQVERVGVGIEWKRDLRVMFRVPSALCPNPYFAR